MNIRLATLSDLADILKVECQCELAAHWTEEQYRQVLHSSAEGAQRLVLVVDPAVGKQPDSSVQDDSFAGPLAGFLVARRIASEWELENIAVHPSARRCGVGSRLVHDLFTRAKSASGQAIFLEVRESNRSARQLYEKTGFKVAGRRNSYYKNPPEDAILYRYDLP